MIEWCQWTEAEVSGRVSMYSQSYDERLLAWIAFLTK